MKNGLKLLVGLVFGLLICSLESCRTAQTAAARSQKAESALSKQAEQSLQAADTSNSGKRSKAVASAVEPKQTDPATSSADIVAFNATEIEPDELFTELQQCSTSDHVVPPDPVPTPAASTGTQSVSEPLPLQPPAESGTVLTFNQAVFAGLNSHPTIGATIEQIRQSQGDLLQSSLLPNPTLFADIQMLPFGNAFTPTRQGGPPQQDVFLTYPIDWFLFGKRTSEMAAKQYAVHVTQADFQDLVRTRIQLVATAFFDVVEVQALEELAQENIENLEAVEQKTRQAVDIGKRPTVDLSRVRLDVLAARQQLRLAHASVISKQAELRSITGWEDGSSALSVVWPLSTPLVDARMPVEQALATSERTRPDLESLRWQVTQACAEVTVEQRAARPEITPGFGWTRQYQKVIDQPDANSWNANVTMSVPIFDRNQGNIAKAQATQHQAQFQYQAKLLDVRAEVRQAVAELQAAEDNAKAVADEQLQLASQVRDSIVEAYSLGGRPLIDVLDAQRNYRETYRLYITTRTAYWTALYRYRAAVGAQVVEHE
ncbi:TolC family protein [Planctomicrobium piriforme]|uniref:Outer membrane protein, cobalt-zinc-cadmium efflux system n=1 Tax=Planctomicrobium piriforme TaxID=1576369 RepID=A0A1I3FYC6_9PLAN|nr:TolC family protein [Planctomicrobium piriforme]SFI16184.1 outer membrane protein, cobalt-zinc-cadmium efflux system [Planctomicrobium piriforme]